MLKKKNNHAIPLIVMKSSLITLFKNGSAIVTLLKKVDTLVMSLLLVSSLTKLLHITFHLLLRGTCVS